MSLILFKIKALSHTSVQGMVTIKSFHKVWPRPFFRNSLCNFRLLLRNICFFFICRLFKLFAIIIFILLFPYSELMLNLCNQLRYFLFRNFIFLQHMRVFLVKLFCSFIRVGMKHQFLKQDCINLFLGICGTQLVVNSYDRRFVSDAKSFFNK